MRNGIPIFLLISLVCSLLFGGVLLSCSNGQSDSETSPENIEEIPPRDTVELSFIVDDQFGPAVAEIQKLYLKEHPEISFAQNTFGIPEEVLLSSKSEQEAESDSAGALSVARKKNDDVQIQEHEPIADMFLLSSREKMDEIEELGLTDITSRFDMLTCDLVVIAKEEYSPPELTWSEVLREGTQLAVQKDIDIFSNKASAPSPLKTASSTEVINAVKGGSADLGVVHRNKISHVKGIKVVCTVPADVYQIPVFPVAKGGDTLYSEQVDTFLSWATSDTEALKIWQKYGFKFPS